MRIIIDAMGGDNAPLEIVKGALQAQKRFGADIVFTGDEAAILAAVRACGFTELRNIVAPQQLVLHRSRQEAEQKAMLLLEKVGLADKAGAYPCNLSGGQCQRVAIARALAMDPEILCFDEPTSALDPQLTQEVLCVIRQLAAEKRTMIVVTHEMNFARDVADRVIYMENGLVAEDGPAKEVLGSARSAAIRAFAGECGD